MPRTPRNLDDPEEVQNFIDEFGALKGHALARRLGFTGTGCVERANALSAYAWNKHTAIAQRKIGNIAAALRYEAICNTVYATLHINDRW